MTTEKTSDFADLMKWFDPAAVADQYKELLGKFSVPNLDTKALIEAQSKNVQALTDANRAILESTRSLLQRQTEMMKQVLEEASEAWENIDQLDDKARGRFWYYWDKLTKRR